MKPRVLLLGRLKSHYMSFMEEKGFKFAKSAITFSRNSGSSKQTVTFCLSKWNSEDDCTFWTTWGVTSREYSRWYAAEWGTKPVNNALGGSADWNIPGWNRGVGQHFHLNGTATDLAEMTCLRENTEAPGIPYLDRISDFSLAAEEHLKQRWMFDVAADFFMIAGENQRARDALYEGIKTFEGDKRPDNFQELPRIKLRLQKYFGIDADTERSGR